MATAELSRTGPIRCPASSTHTATAMATDATTAIGSELAMSTP